MRILWAFSGSFCNHAAVIKEMELLCNKGWEITAILSKNCSELNTRFGTSEAMKERIEKITGKQIMMSLTDAETVGPSCKYDCMVIAPCTSTVIAKLAHGDYDHNCTLAAKAMLRNDKPVVLAIASNDILGNTSEALFRLKQTKNIYLVPFFQDDPFTKANSCISKWNLIENTVYSSIHGKQLQPLLYIREDDYEKLA